MNDIERARAKRDLCNSVLREGQKGELVKDGLFESFKVDGVEMIRFLPVEGDLVYKLS